MKFRFFLNVCSNSMQFSNASHLQINAGSLVQQEGKVSDSDDVRSVSRVLDVGSVFANVSRVCGFDVSTLEERRTRSVGTQTLAVGWRPGRMVGWLR